MEDILEIEEVAGQHSEECFCQLCRPVLDDQDEAAVTAYEPVAA